MQDVLAGVARLAGASSLRLKGSGFDSGQDTDPGYRVGVGRLIPVGAHSRRQPIDVSLSLCLSLSLPPSLSKAMKKCPRATIKKRESKQDFRSKGVRSLISLPSKKPGGGLIHLELSARAHTHTHTHTLEYNKEGNLAYCDNMDGPTGCCMK